MKRWWWIIGSVGAAGLIAGVVLLLLPKNPIPGPIRTQLTSSLFVPGAPVEVDRQSAKYDTKLKLLTYEAAIGGVRTVVSQQPTPESFIDIPQVYDKVVESMNEYTKFESQQGTVHLTRPKDLKGKQAAVINAKGTLMFVKPDKDLSDDQWKRFFNRLAVSS